jgi:hypothetical protein
MYEVFSFGEVPYKNLIFDELVEFLRLRSIVRGFELRTNTVKKFPFSLKPTYTPFWITEQEIKR